MAFTFGFYNSLNGDRRYDAIQMSSIFDGIIRDGIFMSIGTSMMVTAGTGMMVNIGEGRSWFDHTWSLNTSEMPIEVPQSEVLQDRIDTIVQEVDSSEAVRANSYVYVKGVPSTNPVRPTLIKTLSRKQYPLADIRVNRGVITITQANITNRVGTSDTPFITGILDTINIDALVAQWGDQWKQFFNTQTLAMINTAEAWALQWHEWFTTETARSTAEMVIWRANRETEWVEWVASLQAMLDGNVEANMAMAILDLQNRMVIVETFKNRLSTEFKVLHDIQGSDGSNILSNLGDVIEGQIIFAIR